MNNCGKRTGDAGATTSGTGTTAVTSKLSQSELNVIKTMFTVIICFVLCTSVPSIAFTLIDLKVSQKSHAYIPFNSSQEWSFLFGTARMKICDKLGRIVSSLAGGGRSWRFSKKVLKILDAKWYDFGLRLASEARLHWPSFRQTWHQKLMALNIAMS